MAEEEDDLPNFNLAIYGIASPIILTIGFVGNMFSLVVMTAVIIKIQSSNRSCLRTGPLCMYIYMATLAFADLAYVTFAAINAYYGIDLDAKERDKVYVYTYLMPFWNIAKCISDYVVMLMTYNRFMIITQLARFTSKSRCEMAKVTNYQSKKTVLIQIAMVFIGSVAIFSPYFVNVDVKSDAIYGCKPHVPDLGSKSSLYSANDYHFGSCNGTFDKVVSSYCCNFHPLWILFLVINMVLTKIVPLVFVASLNVCTALRLRSVYERRKAIRKRLCDSDCNPSSGAPSSTPAKMVTLQVTITDPSTTIGQGWERRESKMIRRDQKERTMHELTMAKMMIAISVMFLACNIPSNITYMQFMFEVTFKGTQRDSIIQISVTNLLECLTYSLNFYIYCLVHGDIRRNVIQVIKRIFGKCC